MNKHEITLNDVFQAIQESSIRIAGQFSGMWGKTLDYYPITGVYRVTDKDMRTGPAAATEADYDDVNDAVAAYNEIRRPV